MALSPKRKDFVYHYLRTKNASKSARLAGYSPKNAHNTGHRLLKDEEVLALIEKELTENAMDAREVLSRLADIARGDIGSFMDAGPMGYSLRLVDENGELIDQTKLIKRIKQSTTTTENTDRHQVEIELHDPLRALDLIGKHHKLFTEKYEVDTTLEITGLDHLLDTVFGNEADENPDDTGE